MATIEECREKLKSIIDRIVDETKSTYEFDWKNENPNPVKLMQEWAHEMAKDLGLDFRQAPHSILENELKSRILHSALDDFGTAIHRDKTSHGAFEDLPKTREYVYALLARWKPENLLKRIEFIFKRRDLVRIIRIHLAEVELKGLQVDLLWEMIKSWKSMAEKVFLTQCHVEDWDGSSSTRITVVNVETEQEYGHLDTELTKFIGAIVKDPNVYSVIEKTSHDGTMRRTHEFKEHWTPEAILQRAKAHSRSRSSSPSTRAHVALSLAPFSARARHA